MTLNISLGLTVVTLFALSLFAGSGHVPIPDTIAGYFGRGDPLIAMVMQELRLPRSLLAVLVGASLGLAGAAMQGLMRNPLAEPGIVGTSATAALAAVIALQTGFAMQFPLALPLAGIAGAGVSVIVLLALAGGGAGTTTLILAGVAISATAGALLSLVLNLSPNPFAASEIMFWMMGSLADRSFEHIGFAAPFLALGAWLIWSARKGLDALTFGEDTALTLGYDPRRLRLQLILGTAALCGATTATVGAVGFVGLIVPHLLRRMTGGLPSRLLLPSALGAAALVLAADILVRVWIPGRDLKLGVITALIGTPVFLHLVWKSRGSDA